MSPSTGLDLKFMTGRMTGRLTSVPRQAYLFGRNEHHQLSFPLPPQHTVSHKGTDGKPSTTPAAPFPVPLAALPDQNVPPVLKAQGIVEAGVGRSHTILVTEKGEAWSVGLNSLGQCGHPSSEHVSSFRRVGGPLLKEHVVAATAGLNFSLFLTETGKVYAVGSGEKGQLGNGKTGEHIAASKVYFTEQPDPLLVGGALTGKKIVQIASGQQHSVALDDEGYVYAWGFGGLGRLGLGAQYDVLSPQPVPTFAGPNIITRATKIAAGGTNTLFIDGQGMVSLCGKWKVSGDGSAGQPWMTPKPVNEIMGFKWQNISAGGVTLFATTFDHKEEGDFVVGWGQSAHHGELGLGAGSTKSATKPARIEQLNGITMIDLAAGQNTTFLIARPPPTAKAAEAAAAVEAAATDSKDASAKEEDGEAKSAAAPAPTPAAGGIDLSGFGFDFGPPKPAASAAETSSKQGPKSTTGSGQGQSAIATLSRTDPAAWDDLPRHPPVLDAVDSCQICGKDEGPEEPLECEMCELAYHGACLTPPIQGVPDGEWFCPKCSGEELPEPASTNSKKRKANEPAVAKGKKKKS